MHDDAAAREHAIRCDVHLRCGERFLQRRHRFHRPDLDLGYQQRRCPGARSVSYHLRHSLRALAGPGLGWSELLAACRGGAGGGPLRRGGCDSRTTVGRRGRNGGPRQSGQGVGMGHERHAAGERRDEALLRHGWPTGGRCAGRRAVRARARAAPQRRRSASRGLPRQKLPPSASPTDAYPIRCCQPFRSRG